MTRRALVLSVSGLCLLIVLAVFLVPGSPFSIWSQSTVPIEELHGYWKEQVQGALLNYDRDHDVKAVVDRIAGLRVTNEDREIHLALVLAFTAKRDGRAEADQKIQAARQRFEAQP